MTSASTAGGAGWPTHLSPGAVRWARASSRYDETVAFYRDLLGLPVVDEFVSSYGEDGTIFGLPDTTVQLELVRARPGLAPDGRLRPAGALPRRRAAVARATTQLLEAGLDPEPTQHAYWQANGALTFCDPDGRDVVFAPWVYGRDPDPVDRPAPHAPAAAVGRTGPGVDVDWYDGDRAVLRGLFEEAEDSEDELDAYVARAGCSSPGSADEIVGHLQLVDT